MSQIIEVANILAKSVVDPASRYIKQTVIYWSERRYLTFDTYNRVTYVPTGDERIMVITKGAEYRPDLVSYDVYGFSDNWWRIMEANQIKDIFDFKAGRTIILPNQVI